jgi:hypothetical protein
VWCGVGEGGTHVGDGSVDWEVCVHGLELVHETLCHTSHHVLDV